MVTIETIYLASFLKIFTVELEMAIALVDVFC